MTSPPVEVDLWSLGRRGYEIHWPLLQAMRDDAGLALRSVISETNADLAAYEALPSPLLVLPGAARASQIPALATRLFPARRRLARSGGKGRIVHVTRFAPWDLLYLPAAKRSGATILLTVHDATPHPGEESRRTRMVGDKVLALADHVAVLSKHVGEELHRHGGTKKPVHLVPDGLLTTAGPLLAPRAFPAGRPLRLLFFGRIFHYKGLDLLLDAVAALRTDGPPVEVTVAGAGDYAPYRAQLAALDNVTIIDGWISVEDKNRLFAEHDVNMLPYREASQSGNALDGFFAAMPSIASRSGGLVEQLTEDRDSLFTAPESPAEIAEAIRRLAADPALYERLSAGARLSALERGSSQAASSWGALYRKIAAL